MPNQNHLARFFAFVLTVLVSSHSFAQVNGNTGAYSTSIPIRVPTHRGLEPNLALVYNSLAGNGPVGVGWSIAGFPVIERQGADGGTPQFNATDSFRLGGEDLHPCGSSTSPGCLAGGTQGTHFTEHENYQRIVYDEVANEWTIDSRNGHRSTYSPIFTVSGATYRWGLDTVTDTLGSVNTVDYEWFCDPGKDCYPWKVSYNGYRVRFFYRSDRTDPFVFATGDTLGETSQLLRSIKVGAGGRDADSGL